MFNDRFESSDRTIVHVWASASDFAKARRLESVTHLCNLRQDLPAPSICARQPDVLEAVIGKIPTLVTGGAVALGIENSEAAFGSFRNGTFVAIYPDIEWRLFGNDRSFVGRERFCQCRGT